LISKIYSFKFFCFFFIKKTQPANETDTIKRIIASIKNKPTPEPDLKPIPGKTPEIGSTPPIKDIPKLYYGEDSSLCLNTFDLCKNLIYS
jgi:hypothetical protein